MPAKIKISLILFFCISQSVLGAIHPYFGHSSNGSIDDAMAQKNPTYIPWRKHNLLTGARYSSFATYSSIYHTTIQTNPAYIPWKKHNLLTDTKHSSFGYLPTDNPTYDAVIQTSPAYLPWRKHNLLTGARYSSFGCLPMDDPAYDAVIQTNPATPFDETQSDNVAAKKAPFAPPTEGYDGPIGDAVLPLLMFSFVYLAIQLKPTWRNLTKR